MAKSRVEGVASLRRTLRRLEPEIRVELAETLRALGQQMLGRAKAETPVRTGNLQRALAFRVATSTLTLRLGLLTKSNQRKFFYGYILDAGRRGQTVRARRAGGAPYALRISPIAASRYNFVFGRRKDFTENALPRMREAVSNALEVAARG